MYLSKTKPVVQHQSIQIAGLTFASPLLLAPMAGITNAPFRVLMEELGAGGTISELISGNGISHNNKRT
ncbi:MAG: tRNA-dihydrouridine synthase, partial [Oligoflexia bacterium]|nr:tRNA-dihydrouridine synthase [Oligoflexia bacterium]